MFAAQARSRSVTIADIPTDVLRILLSKIVGIEKLEVRAGLASVSKAFAIASQHAQQKAVTLSSMNLVRPYDASSQSFTSRGFTQLQAMIHHITILKLQQVSTYNLVRMIQAASCCQDLNVLYVDLEPRPCGLDSILVECFWFALGDKTSSGKPLQHLQSLRHVLITSADQTQLELQRRASTLDPDKRLACVTTGILTVLRKICLPARLHNIFAQSVYPTAQTDSAMFACVAGLKVLEIGEHCQPLRAPFHGIVRGCLSLATSASFRQSDFVECTGLGADISEVLALMPIESIQTWTSISAVPREGGILKYIAPELESLTMHIGMPYEDCHGTPRYRLQLPISALRSVDVTCDVKGGHLYILGCPSKVAYVRITADVIFLEECLYVRLQTRQTKPLVAAVHKLQTKLGIVCLHGMKSDKITLGFDLP